LRGPGGWTRPWHNLRRTACPAGRSLRGEAGGARPARPAQSIQEIAPRRTPAEAAAPGVTAAQKWDGTDST
jgi:hypothetical protein